MSVEAEVLHQIPLFASLSMEELNHIAAMAIKRHYDRSDIILLEGEMDGALCYVHVGLVKIFKTSLEGREQVLRLIGSGHTFNDVPAFDGGPNPASAAAMEPSVVYMIRRADLHTLILTKPAVAEAVVLMQAKALRHLVVLVEDLSLRHVAARVAKILLDQAATAQTGHHSYHLTQQEMAALAGTAREVVGRALKELEVAGAIEMRQGRAIVLDPERLRMMTSS